VREVAEVKLDVLVCVGEGGAWENEGRGGREVEGEEWADDVGEEGEGRCRVGEDGRDDEEGASRDAEARVEERVDTDGSVGSIGSVEAID
jgi:hypothetical protein